MGRARSLFRLHESGQWPRPVLQVCCWLGAGGLEGAPEFTLPWQACWPCCCTETVEVVALVPERLSSNVPHCAEGESEAQGRSETTRVTQPQVQLCVCHFLCVCSATRC